MSHPDEGPLDEGTLHAYLDGALPSDEARRVEARLAASPEDQRRLEWARAFLAEADDLLELVDLDPPIADPKVVPLTRAPSLRARKRFDPRAFGWAAGFLVIIGGMWLMTPAARRIDEAVVAKTNGPADAAPTTEAAPAAPTASGAPPAASKVQASAGSDQNRERREAAKPASAERSAMDDMRDAAEPQNARATGRIDIVGRAAPSANAVAADTTRRAVVVAAAPASPAAKAALDERAAPQATAARPAPTSATTPIFDLSKDGYEPIVASGISIAQATRLLGHPLRVLPGGNLRSIDQLSSTPPVVRLTYWLQDGTGLTLYESTDAKAVLPAAEETGPAEARSAQRIRGSSPEFRWYDGEVHLRIRSPVMADSLERLRASVRPGITP